MLSVRFAGGVGAARIEAGRQQRYLCNGHIGAARVLELRILVADGTQESLSRVVVLLRLCDQTLRQATGGKQFTGKRVDYCIAQRAGGGPSPRAAPFVAGTDVGMRVGTRIGMNCRP